MRRYEEEFSTLYDDILAGAFPLSPRQIGTLEGALFIREGVPVSEDLDGTVHESLVRRGDFLTGLRGGLLMRILNFPPEVREKLGVGDE